MDFFENVDKKSLRTLLNKNWMTHDAMWFKLSVETVGIEKTNFINRQAVRTMAKIEISRILKLFNLEKPSTVKELLDIIKGCMSLFSENFFDYKFTESSDSIKFETFKCFAYEGVKNLGYIDQYECGIYDRIEGWFEGLGVEYRSNVDFLGCLMHHKGECIKKYRFLFPEQIQYSDS